MWVGADVAHRSVATSPPIIPAMSNYMKSKAKGAIASGLLALSNTHQ